LNRYFAPALGSILLACSATSSSHGGIDVSDGTSVDDTSHVGQTFQSLTSRGTTEFRAMNAAAATPSTNAPDLEIGLARARQAIDRQLDANAGSGAPGQTPLKIPVVQPSNIVTNNPAYLGFPGIGAVDDTAAGGLATPPDQALCVGNGLVLESVNSSLRVFGPLGAPIAPARGLSDFFHMPPYDPATGNYFFPSDPKCLFDRDTQRWFVTVIRLVEHYDPTIQSSSLVGSSLDLAVSATSDPSGAWNLYNVDMIDDGTNGTPKQPGCPCLGDQPLIGADQHGFYFSTNEFGLAPDGGYTFNGAQIYALSKEALVAGKQPTVVHFSSPVLAEGIGVSVQPAVSADATCDQSAGGTEYFLSSLDFSGTLDNRIAVWAVTNTQSLVDPKPSLELVHSVVGTEVYGRPNPARQKAGPTPLVDCVNAGDCAPFLKPSTPYALQSLDAGDDRMMQTVYANGTLWAGLSSVVSVSNETHDGLAWFAVKPQITSKKRVSAKVVEQGYVGVEGNDVLVPSIAMTSDGRGAIAFTLSGKDYYPSAAYALVHRGKGVGDVHVGGAGAAPLDDFSGLDYVDPQLGSVSRWGDYTAAVADGDTIWLSSEFIPNACTTLDCPGRVKWTNWGTFVSHVDLDGMP
jgi:hypothetical protein